MQCPECHRETPGSLGRCTRCDAVLPSGESEATTHEPSGAGWSPEIPDEEPWPPEPWQPAQSRPSWRYDPSGAPEQPSPQPSQQQSQPSPLNWPDPQLDQPQPRPRPLPQSSWPPRDSQPQSRAAQDEQSIPAEERPWAAQEDSLSAEERPWASREQHPWGSPPPSQRSGEWLSEPLPPRRPVQAEEQWIPDDSPRWRGPLVAGLFAALLTAAIVAGFLFWKKQDNTSDGTVADPRPVTTSSSQSQSKAPEKTPVTEEPPAADAVDGAGQAKAIDSLLGDMVESRKKLEVSYECSDKKKDLSTFATAIKERQTQLNDAEELDVSALDQGDDVKAALKGALSASVAFNKEAVKWLKDENGCGGDAAERLKDEISTVAKAKAKFLDLWKPIASDQGLTPRSTDEI